MGRAPCCDKANVKKGPWSPEEDAKLKDYIESSGTGGNWIALPQKIGLRRCGKSCRLRWLNYLRPNIKHGGFSEEEDNIICNLYVTIGSRWSIIAAQLPGRTDNDIKNYWNTRLKKKLLNKQRKEFQEARMKQEMVMMKRQQQGQGQCQSNGSTDLYLNNMFRSSPWPLLPHLPPPHSQVPLVMMEPTSCNYYQPTPSCALEQKPLIPLKNMVKIEAEPERSNPDHHYPEDSMTNSFDLSFSQLLLDPNYYLESGGGEGEFALMSRSTNSPLPNTSSDHHQHQKEITQWFGSSNFQTEAINDVFLNNNNLANFETNDENAKLYANSSVAGAGAAFAGGTTSTSAQQLQTLKKTLDKMAERGGERGAERGGDRGGFGRGFGGGRGDRGGRGGPRGRGGRRGGRPTEEEKWTPVTKLGRLVQAGKIQKLEQIYLHSLPVKEYQIIDLLVGPTLKDEVMKIMPVQKQTRAGQRTRFKAFVVVGDTNGHVGLGVKCSKEVATAIRGGIILAKLSVIPVRRGYWGNKIGKPHTVPCKVTGKCGSVTVRMVPAPRGAGIVAARVPKKVLQFAGIDDVFTSSRGSTKTLGNFVKATFDCLQKTYGFLTPEFWKETSFKKSPYQEYTDLLAEKGTKKLITEVEDQQASS